MLPLFRLSFFVATTRLIRRRMQRVQTCRLEVKMVPYAADCAVSMRVSFSDCHLIAYTITSMQKKHSHIFRLGRYFAWNLSKAKNQLRNTPTASTHPHRYIYAVWRLLPGPSGNTRDVDPHRNEFKIWSYVTVSAHCVHFIKSLQYWSPSILVHGPVAEVNGNCVQSHEKWPDSSDAERKLTFKSKCWTCNLIGFDRQLLGIWIAHSKHLRRSGNGSVAFINLNRIRGIARAEISH